MYRMRDILPGILRENVRGARNKSTTTCSSCGSECTKYTVECDISNCENCSAHCKRCVPKGKKHCENQVVNKSPFSLSLKRSYICIKSVPCWYSTLPGNGNNIHFSQKLWGLVACHSHVLVDRVDRPCLHSCIRYSCPRGRI